MDRGVRRATFRAALLLAAAATPWLARAAEAGAGDPALAARIFSGLGVRQQIEAIVPGAAEQLLGAPTTPDPDRRLLGRIVARGFASERLERASQHAFLASLDSPHALERARLAARWLARPSVRRLHRALAAPRARCEAGEPSAERLRLADAIERASGSRARLRRHADTVARNMSAAADALLPASQRIGRVEPPSAVPPAPVDDARPLACALADLSTAELRSALRFIESDVGRWLYETVGRALDDALALAARRTARELVERFEGRPPALLLQRAALPADARAPRRG